MFSLLLSDLTWDDLDAHGRLAWAAADRVASPYDQEWPYRAALAGMTLVCQPRGDRLAVIMPDRILREALDRRLRQLGPGMSMGEAMWSKCLRDLDAAGLIRRARGKSDPLRGCLELMYDVAVGNAFSGIRLGVVSA